MKPLNAVLITLWTIANQEPFRSIGDRFGLSRGNTHTIFMDTCKLICQLQNTYIKWPTGDNFRRDVAVFNNLRGRHSFPNVIGCVDGTHIAIRGPVNDNSYYNRKGYNSMLLQVICKSNLEFMDVFCGWPGSAHDARVWQNSPIYHKITSTNLIPEEYHLLGDSAYPLDTFIMVPFKDNGHLTHMQRKYNKVLSSTRVVVEQALGRLKEVFRRLKYLNITNLSNFKYIVLAACILHNFCIIRKIDHFVDELLDDNNFDGMVNDYEAVGIGNRRARNKRDRIMLNL